MNKKYIVRLSDEERECLPRDHQETQRLVAEVPPCADSAQGGCRWARMAGCQDRRGFRLSRANDRESPQTAGHRRL